MSTAISSPPVIFRQLKDDSVLVELSGDWRLRDGLPPSDVFEEPIELRSDVRRISFDATKLADWDSGLLTLIVRIINHAKRQNIETDTSGLPEGVQRLLKLSFAVPEKADAARTSDRTPLLELVGASTLELYHSLGATLGFIGESVLVFGRFFRGKARFRRCDLALTIQECGADALPIVSLISLLVGLILAFVGAVQLSQFGAQIFVADLVGLAMTREMAAIMTGIIVAGRTGAAFAAQLGTMTVNEEIDALGTFSISPMEFLVLPRMLALAIMMPLLCIYADLLGILGGAVVGVGLLDLSITQYVSRTQIAVGLGDIAVGLVKGALFGILVALAGCMRGMQCGRSSAAVGLAATSAVVTGIVFIIVTDAIFAVVTNILGV